VPQLGERSVRELNKRVFIIISAGILIGLFCIPALPFVLAAGLTAYSEFDEWRYQEPNEFSERKWKSSDKYRWNSIDLVIEEKLREKIKREEVIAILGAPDKSTPEGHVEYDAERPGFHLIDFSGGGLLIKFTPDGYLESSTNTTWVD